jgi:hypothetical protein
MTNVDVRVDDAVYSAQNPLNGVHASATRHSFHAKVNCLLCLRIVHVTSNTADADRAKTLQFG